MKRLISMAMALAMVLALASCGGNSTPAETTAPETTAPETTAAETSAPETTAAETAAAETEAAEGALEKVSCEPLTIMFSTNYNQTETGGEIIQHWIDTLGEITDGAITVDPYWGGTLYSDPDILDGLSSGAVNMTTFGHMPHTGTLNYLAFPGFAPGGSQAALDYFNDLVFEDPETSALIQGELADNNVIFLNTLAGGANAFCAKNEFTDLASLVSGTASFGNMDAAIFEALGFQVTSVGPGDCYDALQRGMIDATQMGLTPMVSMQWYDVAPYWALDGTYSAGNFIAANLEWWEGLSADQQKAIEIASDDVEAYSLELNDNATDGDVAAVEAATGNAFVEFSDEDIAAIWAATFESKAEAAMTTAESNGKAEGMQKILDKAAVDTGYSWSYAG